MRYLAWLPRILLQPRCYGCDRSLPRGSQYCADCRRELAVSGAGGEYLFFHRGAVKTIVERLRGHAPLGAVRLCEATLRRQAYFARWRNEGINLVTVAPRARPRAGDGLPILARAIAAGLGADFRITLKKDANRAQHGRGRHQRMNASPFLHLAAAPAAVMGRRVLVIDDVDTTGTTLDQATYRLRQAGAKSVARFSVARQMVGVVEGLEGKSEEAEEKSEEVEPLLLHLFM